MLLRSLLVLLISINVFARSYEDELKLSAETSNPEVTEIELKKQLSRQLMPYKSLCERTNRIFHNIGFFTFKEYINEERVFMEVILRFSCEDPNRE
ncbi:MAG: hypothetical protein VX642_05880 [Bdellovibrionota bacterium]|nr:hypothetical protein [Bdellovibrionota bacterium]